MEMTLVTSRLMPAWTGRADLGLPMDTALAKSATLDVTPRTALGQKRRGWGCRVIDSRREELVGRISDLIVQERSLRRSPFAAVVALYRGALDGGGSIDEADRDFFQQRLEQQLLLSALNRREAFEVCEKLWRSTMTLGFETRERYGSFSLSIAALCVRNGWIAFTAVILDELEKHVSELPEVIVFHLGEMRKKIIDRAN